MKENVEELLRQLEDQAVLSGIRLYRHLLECGCGDAEHCPSELARSARLAAVRRDVLRTKLVEMFDRK